MLGEDRQVSRLACFLLVTLRLFIGWHLLYEGLWKLHTQSTSQPWSAEGYLKNASGPLRQTFRDMTGDPDDLGWLDYDRMVAKWDDWVARYSAHYPGVTEAPAGGGRSIAEQLAALVNGEAQYAAELAALPEGLDLSKWKRAITFDAAQQRLIVDGTYHLLPAERDAILAAIPATDDAAQQAVIKKFTEALARVYTLQSRLSFKDRLAALLKGDPERVGVLQKEKDVIIEQRMGQVEQYKTLLARYEANYAAAKTDYQWKHLSQQWVELQQLRRQLVGPVQALENELKTTAIELLSPAQLAAGPVPEPMTPIRSVNLQTMWGLTICGGLLLMGLFTRLAALGGAGLLTMFYLAIPPWPGTPPEPGPEHNYIVNKVLVEMTACLALAALPTGRWFGVDALLGLLFFRKRARKGG